MKTIAILLVGLGVGICASFAQTGVPAVPAMPPITAPAPPPAITAPMPAATVRPKPSRRSQDAEQRKVRRPAAENATPGPRQNRQNSQAHRPPPPVAAVSYADALKRQHRQRHDRQWWTTRYRIIVLV